MKPASEPRRRRGGAALLAVLLGLLCLLPAARTAVADEANPAMEVTEVGWDGHITMGAWAPIRVKLTGAARDLDALVEVTLENQYQTGPNNTVRFPLAAFAQEVSLPASASKEVTVWVPTGNGLFGTVRLKAGDQELGKEEIEFRATKAPYWPLVGVLSGEESLAARVKRIELPLQNLPTAINVAQLKPEALPLQPDRMKGLRAMVVQGNTPSKLTDGQRESIAKWVQNGGHLLLAGGPDSALTAAVLPAGSLPVTFGGTEMSLDLTPLLAWTGAAGTEAAQKGPGVKLQTTGGTVLAGTAERPLAWRTLFGKGSITVLAVDPTLEPLASWEGTIPLLKKALSPAFFEESQGEDEKFRMMNMEQDLSYRLRDSVNALPADAYPGWQQVVLYLGGFALIAGPLIHLLFWQGKRRGWVWLAVPAASLVMAGSIYLVGITVNGRDLLGHTISYVQIDPESQTASQMMMVGLYAPMHDKLAVTVDSDAPVNAMGLMEGPRFTPWGPETSPALEPPFRLVTGRETRMEFYSGEGAMRPLTLARTLGSQAGRIVSSLRLDGDLIKGTITNETPYHLEDAAVAVGIKVVKLGDLAPGQSAEVSLEPTSNSSPFQHISLAGLFFGVPLDQEELRRRGMPAAMPPGMPEQLNVPQKPEIQRRSRLLESLLYRPSPGRESTSLPLIFVAFTRDPVGPTVVDLTGHPSHFLSLIEQRLQVEVPSGPFKVPSTMIPSTMAMNNVRGMGSSSNGTLTWMEINSGSVSFTFTPPLPREARITALEITTQLMGDPMVIDNTGRTAPPPPNAAPQAAIEGIFQVYNWNAAAWENLPGGQETVRLTKVADYLSPANEVRLQVVAGGGQLVRFVTPTLNMEGRGEQ